MARNRAWRPESLTAQALGKIDETTRAVVPPLHVATTYERDPDGGYSFEKPCPGTEIRINKYDADATTKSTAKFSRITSVPAAMAHTSKGFCWQ